MEDPSEGEGTQLVLQMEGQPAKRGPGRPPGPKVDKVAAITAMVMQLGFRMSFDEFRNEVIVKEPGKAPRTLEDLHEMMVRVELASRGINVQDSLVHDVMITLARRDRVHPVREYLDGLVWDGESRLDTWLSTYMHAEDNKYTRKVAAATLIAAVRRVRQPGCKFDECLMLVSDEGTGKSSAIRALVPDQRWVTESLNVNASPKQVIEGTRGVWIAEGAEMAGIKDVEHVKAFLSRQVDGPVREAYARNSTTVPRQFIVIGTTNERRPLANETGARRFWPVKTGSVDLAGLRRDRDQIWAEAATRELFGEETHVTGELFDEVMEAQNSFSTADPWREIVEEVIAHLPVKGIVPVKALWAAIGVESGRQTHAMSVRMTNVMRKLGFKKPDKPVYCAAYGGTLRAYVKLNPFEKEAFVTALSATPEDEAEAPTMEELGEVVEEIPGDCDYGMVPED